MPLPGMMTSLGPTGTVHGGFVEVAATVTAIINSTYYATDKMGKTYDNLVFTIGSGPKPQVNEIWMLEKKSTGWCFSYPIIANPRVVTTTTDITAVVGQTILADATEGDITVTLTPSLDAEIVVKVISGNANTVTVISSGGESVEGVSWIALSARQCATFSFNTNWWILHLQQAPLALVVQLTAATTVITSATARATHN